jgi:polyisoprenoid-binding protein YceI
VDDRSRGLEVTPLFEPREVLDADAGEHRDLLTTQAGRTPPAAARQADVLGVEPLAAGTQELAQFEVLPGTVVHHVIVPWAHTIQGGPASTRLGAACRVPPRASIVVGMTSATPTTELALPAGTYTLDPYHSSVHFQIKHLGLSNVRGTFKSFTTTLVVGETLADVAVEASIDLSSIDTGQPDRDAHLLGTDFFDADRNPTMSFRSTSITQRDANEYDMTGELTINGVTRPATFRTEFNGTEIFPADQSVHVGFTATGEIRRGDFGIDFNMPLGVDKLAMGEKVKVELDIQFVAPTSDS